MQSMSGTRVPNTLAVCVLEARDVSAEGPQLVVAKYSGQEFKTQSRQGASSSTNAEGDIVTSRVTWDERVLFVAARNPITAVEFKLYAGKHARNHVGSGYISVNTVRELRQDQSRVRQVWLDIVNKLGENKGKLRVAVGWSHRDKVSGKSRLAVFSRLGITRKAPGENLDVLPEGEGEELGDDETNWDTDGTEGEAEQSQDVLETSGLAGGSGETKEESTEEDKGKEIERREKEAERLREKLEAARKKPVKEGTWRVIFHIIELRELKAEDLQGTSDPVCVVTVDTPLRKTIKRTSSIKKGVRSCVFDEQLFLDLKDMDSDSLGATSIKFAVYDADLISRNDLIGSFTFDLLDSYYNGLKKVWIGLIDERSTSDNGVQGYARVSLTILGPGDTAALPSEEEDESDADGNSDDEDGTPEDEIGEVLLPPNVEQSLHFLRFKLYQAEDLPALDSNRLTGSSGIDAFVNVRFDSNATMRSKVISKSRPKGSEESLKVVFNEEFWLPTFNHRIAKGIKILLYDYDKGSRNDLVSTLLLNYQDVLKAPGHKIRPRWYNLYGAPGSGSFFSNPDRHRMNANPAFGSAYRGRVLIGLQDFPIAKDDATHTEVAHKVPIRSLRRSWLPTETTYVLRLWAISASEVPKMQKFLGIKTKTQVALSIAIGPHCVRTSAQRPKKGFVKWGQALELQVSLPDELIQRWSSDQVQRMVSHYDQLTAEIEQVERQIPDQVLRIRSLSSSCRMLPPQGGQHRRLESMSSPQLVDRLQSLDKQRTLLRDWILNELKDAQVPDIFLYLEDDTKESISFIRFRPEELLLRRMERKAEWIALQEDKANDNLDDDDFAGSVQVALGFGTMEQAQASASQWDASHLERLHDEMPYNVRVNVYQGADLPAADSTGLCDPYAYVKCLGHTKKISKRYKTCDPLWYETVEFTNVMLPHPDFAPQVVLDIFEWDKYDSDDYLGTARIDLVHPRTGEYKTNSKAAWAKIFQVVPGDCGDGAVLVSVEVLPANSNPPLPPSIEPVCTRKTKLQIAVLGLRQLESYRGIPVANPRVEFHLGDASRSRNVKSTKRGKGSNPNFGELIELQLPLPDDLVFLPRLHVTVLDSRFGGLENNTIATSTIDLSPYVPGSPTYRPIADNGPMSLVHAQLNPNVAESPNSAREELEMFLHAPAPSSPLSPSSGSAAASGVLGGEGDSQRDGGELHDELEEEDSYEDGDDSQAESTSLEDDAEQDDDLHGRSEEDFVEWPNHDPLPLPAFMNGRETLPSELENYLGASPFERFPVMRGSLIRKSFLGRKLKPNLRQVGVLKAVLRVIDDNHDSHVENESEEDVGIFRPDMLDKLMTPRNVEIRLYALKGFNFTPMDIGGGKSDPYLVVQLGSQKISDQKNYIPNTINPCFYRRFELTTQLPGVSTVKIKAMDYDTFSSDDLIGETFIDLEDRWLSQRWHNLCMESTWEERTREELTEEEKLELNLSNESQDASLSVEPYWRKPVELRSLWNPTSQLEQGKLEVWCDIMEQSSAIKYPIVDVSPPDSTVYEMRVIIWKSEDVPAFDMFTKQNDLYVRANFNGWSEKKWLYTDTHWRCKKGKGSWNYRLKFKDIKLPLPSLKSRLTLQIWDKDIAKWSDCIAESILDLDAHLKAAFLRNEETYQVFDDGARKVPGKYKTGLKPQKPSPVSNKPLPVSTEETLVQPDGSPNGTGKKLRTPSEISITIDQYTGVARTNAEADDVAFAPKRAKKRQKKKTGPPQKKTKKAGKNSKPNASSGETEKKTEARELISTYAPWATDLLATQRPPHSKPLKLYAIEDGKKKDMGILWVSVELVRKDAAETTLSNGSGRSEPNRFPRLPKPVGRLKWSLMWNPFYLLRECLGPELCTKFCICFIITAVVVASIFLMPQVSGLVSFISSTGPFGYVVLALILAVLIGCCCYCAISDRIRRREEEQSLVYDLEYGRPPQADQDQEEVRNCCSCCGPSKPTPSTTKRVDPSTDDEEDGAQVELLQL